MPIRQHQIHVPFLNPTLCPTQNQRSKNIKIQYLGPSLLEYFHSDDLTDMQGEHRSQGSWNIAYIPANRQAVIMARRKGRVFLKLPLHYEQSTTQNPVLAHSAKAASEHLLNKLLPLADCALSLCLVAGPFAEMLAIYPGMQTLCQPRSKEAAL